MYPTPEHELQIHPKQVLCRRHLNVVVNVDANANKGVLSIKFHWSDIEIEASVLQLVAGNSYGTLFMPQIGESVLVGFEASNALCPFIYGAFYNGANLSTYLPMQSGIKIQNN